VAQLLIDADLWLYKSTAAAEYEGDWGDGVIVASTNIEQAKAMFNSMLDATKEALNSDDIVFILSGSDNFRYTLTDTYKSNRKGNRKPLGYSTLSQWLRDTFEDRVFSKDNLEADDYMGILATTPVSEVERIIVSEDKDMMTIPGKLYRQGQLSTISEEQADRYWWFQTLTGDPADGYKGCSGVGAVKAEKILSKNGSYWENVKKAFLDAGHDEEYAILQARLARILRIQDWDRGNQVPILWTPPESLRS
jgi:DNA polymerase-1